MRRISFTLLLLLLLLPVLAQAQTHTYSGTITRTGYSPPSTPTWVTWCRAGSSPECRSYPLNPSISWNGQDGPTKYARYASGDTSVQGWSVVPAVWGEAKGGEAGAALLYLYRQSGLTRQYTEQELADFTFSNTCGTYLCGCSWYERVTGSPHPITPGCLSTGTGGGSGSGSGTGAPQCPNDPPGCGVSKSSPCPVVDPSLPTDKPVQRVCWGDKKGGGQGKIGKYMIRKEEGGKDPDPGTDPDPAPPSPRCFLLTLSSDPASTPITITPTPCDRTPS